MNMALDAETIEKLLKGEIASLSKKTPTGVPGQASILPRPIQLGPLKWYDTTQPCASRGCTSPTYIKIRGISYCTTHALNMLNQIIIQELEGIDTSKCNCKAGVHSKNNIHTYDCDLVKLSDIKSEIEELL